jgi:hypothetical protein
MDGHRFDRFTTRIFSASHSRRTALRAGSMGLASALATLGFGAQSQNTLGKSVTAAATPEATPTNPNDIEIGGMWFCNQTFALCTTAPCELSESDPTIANCHCIVETFYSIGAKSCTERAQSGKSLVSNFSTVNVNSEFSIMTCPEDAPWANCLDVPCEIDSFNPAVATCQCVMVETGPSLTFGGGCDTSTCTSTIWSAAPTGYIGLEQYEEGMKQVNQKVTLPVTCPAGTPAASPTS